jgi:hypothetical protein
MAKNRIIYQSQSVYAGPAAPSGDYVHETGTVSTTSRAKPTSLQRVQNVNYSFDIARTDVNQFGQLANIDRVILESPTVSMDFSYYSADFANEKALGFTIMSNSTLKSSISGMLKRETDERNYYIRVASDGQDSVGDLTTGTGTNDVVGIGNGFLSSYSADASVGDFPTCSVTVEALNIAFDKGMTGNNIPQVNPADGAKNSTKEYALDSATANVQNDYSVVRPGDITMTLDNGGLGALISDAKIQSYSLSFDLAREPLQKLGNKFAFAREMTFPVTVSLSVDALLGDLETGNLADVISSDANFDAEILMKSGTQEHMRYMLKRAKLDGHSYSTSIGDNKTVTLNFSSQLGSSQQTGIGLFMSGVGHDS